MILDPIFTIAQAATELTPVAVEQEMNTKIEILVAGVGLLSLIFTYAITQINGTVQRIDKDDKFDAAITLMSLFKGDITAEDARKYGAQWAGAVSDRMASRSESK